MSRVSSPKDLWSGLIYLGFGLGGLWFGAAYPMGTAGRMGSGYFPKVLAAVLVGFGVVAIVRSLVLSGEPVSRLHWKPIVLILAACALFGLLLQPAGMIPALFVLTVLSAAASAKFRLEARALLGVVALIAACALIFVKGLGVQMPLLGSWFDPVTAQFPWLR
jgi:Tripartite tricarboxylate transporter TctB family